MKKIYFLIGTAVVLFSACTQNEIDEQASNIVSPQNKNCTVIHFDSAEDFFEEYNTLLEKTQEEQKAWAISKSSNALLSALGTCNDSTMLKMPKAFQALFNKQLEVEINDSTIQYKNGNLYLTELKKSALKESILCGNGKSTIVEDENVQTRQIGDITFGKIGMGRQREFSRGGKYTYKYVHEFRSTVTTINNISSSVIGLIIKLEYRGSGSWKPAGIQRDITFTSFDCHASIRNAFYGNIVQFGLPNQTIRGQVGDREFPIARVAINDVGNTHVWTINCTGKISHTISAEPNTAWDDIR